jgi:hypothetical protein
MSDASTNALALRRALTGLAFPLSDQMRSGLRGLVCGYADAMKAQGWSTARAVVAVQRLANDAGLYASPRVVWATEVTRGPDSLVVDLVSWTVERFHGPGEW